MRTRNPDADKFIFPEGYKDLGWQRHSGNSDDVKQCREAKHKTEEFDNSTFIMRGTDVITICNECKTIYHIDMSD